MVYRQMPIIEVAVLGLRLDLDNYRIPVRPDDEAAALNYLFAAEDVLGQARLFLRDGYFDNEVPIVVKQGRSYVVLEGNRRVSALKAIADPQLVPEHEHQVRELLTRFDVEKANIPTTIRVLVAPSREAAAPHIARLHTGIPKKRWSRDQQGNYYFSLLGPRTQVEDLRERYPGVDVVRFLRMVAMRQFLTGVKFKDKSLAVYVRGPSLTMSAFEYAYRPPDLAAAMGVEFEAERIKPAASEPERIGATLTPRQRDAVEHLMTGFRADLYNTRSFAFRKNSEAKKQLLSFLLGEDTGSSDEHSNESPTPEDTNSSGEGSTEDPSPTGNQSNGGHAGNGSDGDPEADSTAGQGGNPRGPNHPDTRRGFVISGFPVDRVPSNLLKRYQELRKINVSETPAAAAMLLRSVLESTIKFHFSGTSSAVSGELGRVLPAVVAAYGSERALKAVISTVSSGPVTRAGSLQWFNAAAHNPDFPLKETDVRDAYSLIESCSGTCWFRLLRPPCERVTNLA